MAENNGYILLAKSMRKKKLYANSVDVHVFIECLFRTNWKDEDEYYRGALLKPGQFAFGRFEMSATLGLNPSTLYKSIKRLQKQNRIDVNSNNKFSIGTTLNYKTYQDPKWYKEQRSNNKVTTREQQGNTIETVETIETEKKKKKKEISLPRNYPISDWVKFEAQLKSVNPDLDFKQIIGFKKKSIAVFEAGKSLEGFFDFELEKNTKREIKLPQGLKSNDFKRLLEHRKKNKQPVDNIALYKLSLKLLKMHSEGYDTLSVIEETIDNNWKGFFPKEHHLRRSL